MRPTKWKRKFFTSEHEKRDLDLAWKRREFKLLKTISDLSETNGMLAAEIRMSKCDLQSHMRAIRRMQTTLSANQIPIFPAMMSMKICAASESESCPIALELINSCPPPFEGCCSVLDQMKQEQKCTELACKHRFNGVWLMYHFVRNKTFSCPVCRQGKKNFTFDPDVVPPCMASALGRV
jgi:hypothetical protein